MPAPVRMRLACDRCHSQKLKCPKRPGSNICSRCLKAGSACTYSPPGAVPGVPNDAVVEMEMSGYDPVLGGNAAGTSFDWLLPPTSSDLDAYLTTIAPAVSHQDSGHPTEQAGAETQQQLRPATEAASDKLACTKRLTDLMFEMDRLWASLPHQSALHRSRGETVEHYAVELLLMSPKCMLEQIFVCGQGLVDVYPLATKFAMSLAADPSFICDVPDCIHGLSAPDDLLEIDKHASTYDSTSTIDHALANQLISCHLRFLDVLERVCIQVVMCFKVTFDSPTLREPEFDVVQMRVGAYVPEKNASVLMQFALLKHILGVLSAKAIYFHEAISSTDPSTASAAVRVIGLQCEILQERHQLKTQQVRVLEANLVKFGAMKH